MKTITKLGIKNTLIPEKSQFLSFEWNIYPHLLFYFSYLIHTISSPMEQYTISYIQRQSVPFNVSLCTIALVQTKVCTCQDIP